MNYNRFYCEVSLPSIVVDEEILHRSERTPYQVSNSDINPEVISILNSKGFGVHSIEIFKTCSENKRWVVHIDGYPEWYEKQYEGDLGKINWVYGNLDCDMKWFKEREKKPRETRYNDIGPYVVFEDEDVDEIASFNIGKASIVQAGIPHTVINNTGEDRYCVSIHLSHPSVVRVPFALLKHNLGELCINP